MTDDLTPPRLRDDCFAMPQGVDWVPVDDALARLRAALAPINDTLNIHPSDALGYVLAQVAIAKRANPLAAGARGGRSRSPV